MEPFFRLQTEPFFAAQATQAIWAAEAAAVPKKDQLRVQWQPIGTAYRHSMRQRQFQTLT
eukprot:171230-Pelagomonas_calceolata.AAC.3